MLRLVNRPVAVPVIKFPEFDTFLHYKIDHGAAADPVVRFFYWILEEENDEHTYRSARI